MYFILFQRVTTTEGTTTTPEGTTTTPEGTTTTPSVDTTTPEPICVWNGIEYEYGKRFHYFK